MIPAGWIPPDCREFVTTQLTDAEADKLVGSCGETVNGKLRHFSREEIKQKFPKVLGVIDTRDGTFHPNQSKTLFVQATIGGPR